MFVTIYNPIVGIIYAVVFGFGFGLGNPGRLAILGEFFGRKAYGSLLGTQQFLSSITGIIAPVYAGFMFDLYGADGYRIAFLSLALPGAISVYLYLSMKVPVIEDKPVVI
jgi:MFS family permease